MRITILLLLVGVCLVSAKYLPYDESDTSVLVRSKRSHSDESVPSIDRDDSSDTEEENKEDNSNEDEDDKLKQKLLKRQEKRKRKEEEAKRKLEEKQAKEQRKEEEKREKEERKRLERIEKLKRKEEEKQKKLREKKEKEEKKRQEKERKQLEKLQKEALEDSEEDDFLATKEEDSIELSGIWRNHIYVKYGLNFASTKSEKQAAIDKYLQEELGLNSNSTESDRRQAIKKLIETKLQNDTASQEALKNQLIAHINILSLSKWQAQLEKDITELNNKSQILSNVMLPWANVTQQKLEEKKSFLQTISKFLSDLFPSWINSGQNQTQPGNNSTDVISDTIVENAVVGSNDASSVSNIESNYNVSSESGDASSSTNVNDVSLPTENGGLPSSNIPTVPTAVNDITSSISSDNNESVNVPNSEDSLSSGGSSDGISSTNVESPNVPPNNVDSEFSGSNDGTVNNNVNLGTATSPATNTNSVSTDQSLDSDKNTIIGSSPSAVSQDVPKSEDSLSSGGSIDGINSTNVESANVPPNKVDSEFSGRNDASVSNNVNLGTATSPAINTNSDSTDQGLDNDTNTIIESSSSGLSEDVIENNTIVESTNVQSESSGNTDSAVTNSVNVDPENSLTGNTNSVSTDGNIDNNTTIGFSPSGVSTDGVENSVNVELTNVSTTNVNSKSSGSTDFSVNSNVNSDPASSSTVDTNIIATEKSINNEVSHDTNLNSDSPIPEVSKNGVENNADIGSTYVSPSIVQSESFGNTDSTVISYVNNDPANPTTINTNSVSADESSISNVNSSNKDFVVVEGTVATNENVYSTSYSSSNTESVNTGQESLSVSSDNPSYITSGPGETTNIGSITSSLSANFIPTESNVNDVINNSNVRPADISPEYIPLEKSNDVTNTNVDTNVDAVNVSTTNSDSALNGSTETTNINKDGIDVTTTLNINSISDENSKDIMSNSANAGSSSLNTRTDLSGDSNTGLDNFTEAPNTESTNNSSIILEQNDNALTNNGGNDSTKNDSILPGANNNSRVSTENATASNIASASVGNSDVASEISTVSSNTITNNNADSTNVTEIGISVNNDLLQAENNPSTANIEPARNVNVQITVPTEAGVILSNTNVSITANNDSAKTNVDAGSLDVASTVSDNIINTTQAVIENKVTNPDTPTEADLTLQSTTESVVNVDEIVSNANTAFDIAITEIPNDVSLKPQQESSPQPVNTVPAIEPPKSEPLDSGVTLPEELGATVVEITQQLN